MRHRVDVVLTSTQVFRKGGQCTHHAITNRLRPLRQLLVLLQHTSQDLVVLRHLIPGLRIRCSHLDRARANALSGLKQNVVDVVVRVVERDAHAPNELADHGSEAVERRSDTRLLDDPCLRLGSKHFFDGTTDTICPAIHAGVTLQPCISLITHRSVGGVDVLEGFVEPVVKQLTQTVVTKRLVE